MMGRESHVLLQHSQDLSIIRSINDSVHVLSVLTTYLFEYCAESRSLELYGN